MFKKKQIGIGIVGISALMLAACGNQENETVKVGVVGDVVLDGLVGKDGYAGGNGAKQRHTNRAGGTRQRQIAELAGRHVDKAVRLQLLEDLIRAGGGFDGDGVANLADGRRRLEVVLHQELKHLLL